MKNPSAKAEGRKTRCVGDDSEDSGRVGGVSPEPGGGLKRSSDMPTCRPRARVTDTRREELPNRDYSLSVTQ
jgi:hypothetical protein